MGNGFSRANDPLQNAANLLSRGRSRTFAPKLQYGHRIFKTTGARTAAMNRWQQRGRGTLGTMRGVAMRGLQRYKQNVPGAMRPHQVKTLLRKHGWSPRRRDSHERFA
jgi:hypothetical protein